MTQFTSFVAVEDRVITKDGKPQRVEVPVEMPDGVDYEHVFGNEQEIRASSSQGLIMRKMAVGSGFGGGVGAAVGPGSGGGGRACFKSKSVSTPPPLASPQLQVSQDIRDRSKTEPDTKPTGERAILESKLHPEIMKAFECWKKSGEQCEMLQNGRLHVQIFLSGSPAMNVGAQLQSPWLREHKQKFISQSTGRKFAGREAASHCENNRRAVCIAGQKLMQSTKRNLLLADSVVVLSKVADSSRDKPALRNDKYWV